MQDELRILKDMFPWHGSSYLEHILEECDWDASAAADRVLECS